MKVISIISMLFVQATLFSIIAQNLQENELSVLDSVYQYSEEQKYGFGAGVTIGGGYFIPSGSLSNYQANAGLMQIGFLFSFARISYDMVFQAANSSSSNKYVYNELTIYADSITSSSSFENCFGYRIIDNEKHSLTPFIGFNIYTLAQRINDEKVSNSSQIGGLCGISYDYKFSNSFGSKYMGDLILGTRINYNFLNDYYKLDVSSTSVSLYFRFHIRGYKKKNGQSSNT